MKKEEICSLQSYLRTVFRSADIRVEKRKKKDDSAEVYIGEEFIGLLFRDDEEEEVSYSFQMSILNYDLPVD
ncbi:MAG: DUF3126 family protein [Alphaproteobacteria bacterium]|nr:DUF3126 family protein [Alphaproteobacteria bacterium]